MRNGEHVSQGAGYKPEGGFEAAPRPALTPSEDRQWAMVSHFGAILGFIPSFVIYMVYRERGPFTAQESKEALNFTLPLTVVAIALNILAFLPVIGALFGVLTALLWIFMTISGLLAGVEVNKGRPYRYPFNLRLIR